VIPLRPSIVRPEPRNGGLVHSVCEKYEFSGVLV
jgi:hypothetical protein